MFAQSNGIEYFYDENSSPIAFAYNGEVYYYKKDLLGNVIEILDITGTTVVKYVYDAWGNHKVLNPDGTENTSTLFIGNINPIRYRSYYFDTEIGLYFLQTRITTRKQVDLSILMIFLILSRKQLMVLIFMLIVETIRLCMLTQVGICPNGYLQH